MNWRRGRQLRAAVHLAGRLLLLSGLLAVATMVPTLTPLSVVWPFVLVLAGVVVVGRLLRVQLRSTRNGLTADILVMAAALLTGGVVESLHSLGVLPPSLFHLTLAASLALIGVFLLTTNADRLSAPEQQALEGMRLAGYVFLLAGVARGFVVGLDQMHGLAAALSMGLVAIAGFVLMRTASTVSSTVWHG